MFAALRTMNTVLTRSERETLKSIYRLTSVHGAATDAHTGALAEAMGVSPATVTATVKRLADRGLADHKPYRGVEVLERLYVALDRPASCPHGFPIPAPEVGHIPELPPLYALEPGDVAVVAVPGSTDPAVVAFLDTLGLRPGVRIEVREKHPFDGPLVLLVDGHRRTVGDKVARQIYVHLEASEPAPLAPLDPIDQTKESA